MSKGLETVSGVSKPSCYSRSNGEIPKTLSKWRLMSKGVIRIGGDGVRVWGADETKKTRQEQMCGCVGFEVGEPLQAGTKEPGGGRKGE